MELIIGAIIIISLGLIYLGYKIFSIQKEIKEQMILTTEEKDGFTIIKNNKGEEILRL